MLSPRFGREKSQRYKYCMAKNDNIHVHGHNETTTIVYDIDVAPANYIVLLWYLQFVMCIIYTMHWHLIMLTLSFTRTLYSACTLAAVGYRCCFCCCWCCSRVWVYLFVCANSCFCGFVWIYIHISISSRVFWDMPECEVLYIFCVLCMYSTAMRVRCKSIYVFVLALCFVSRITADY